MDLRLNLGCGPGLISSNYSNYDSSRKLFATKVIKILKINKIIDWNSDWDTRVRYRNVCKLNFTENSVDEVYSSHLLEHLYLDQALKLISDIHMWLKPGGLFRIVLPDYDHFIDSYIAEREKQDGQAIENFRLNLVSFPAQKPNIGKSIWRFLKASENHQHKWYPTKSYLFNILQESGFSSILQYKYRVGNLKDLELIETRATASFYIECVK